MNADQAMCNFHTRSTKKRDEYLEKVTRALDLHLAAFKGSTINIPWSALVAEPPCQDPYTVDKAPEDAELIMKILDEILEERNKTSIQFEFVSKPYTFGLRVDVVRKADEDVA